MKTCPLYKKSVLGALTSYYIQHYTRGPDCEKRIADVMKELDCFYKCDGETCQLWSLPNKTCGLENLPND